MGASMACWKAPMRPRAAQRLKNFQQISAFRKILLIVLSRQLATNDLPDMYEAFKTLDRDGDGKLSHKELHTALSTRMESQELEQVLDAMDVDGSGCVDYSEFLAAAFDRRSAREDLILQVFRALDRDESGTVGIQELHAMLDDVQGHEGVSAALREEARELLEQYDQDGDGLLNFDEFRRLLTRQTSADHLRDARGAARKGRPGLETWSVGQVNQAANQMRLSGTIRGFKKDLDEIKQELSEKSERSRLSEKTPRRLSGPVRFGGGGLPVVLPPEAETPDKNHARLDEPWRSSRRSCEGRRLLEAPAAAARPPQTGCLTGCLAVCPPLLRRWR
ncbi:unnamed protein product [Prorocentrum cordatum]|uniref:EF-hand domain-containing protein n=1 Tax=Prorocentrum cordatum TaxID=2364126 RepID=A0ABN9UEE7_9DINO|nr:unnamed protein product [Polarella glacialis]